ELINKIDSLNETSPSLLGLVNYKKIGEQKTDIDEKKQTIRAYIHSLKQSLGRLAAQEKLDFSVLPLQEEFYKDIHGHAINHGMVSPVVLALKNELQAKDQHIRGLNEQLLYLRGQITQDQRLIERQEAEINRQKEVIGRLAAVVRIKEQEGVDKDR